MSQNRRPGDWDCDKCGFMNFGSRAYCKNCPEGQRPYNNNPFTSNHGASNYGASNYGASNYGASNYGTSNYGASNYGVSNYGNPVRERPGDWYCDVCGFMNFKNRTYCKECNVSKYGSSKRDGISPTKTYKTGDWHCNKCGFLNFGNRPYCKDCNTSKLDSSTIQKKPGDWNCTQCGFINFKQRMICKVCNNSKSATSPYIQSNRKQKFRYLIVLDFEATCNEPQNPNPQEIIEWPAMIIDTTYKSILDKYFHFYVKPTIHPIISDFCTNLTGITQQMVDKGENIKNVIKAWNTFCFQNKLLPNNKNEATSCIVTCGDWDLNVLWPQNDKSMDNNNNNIDESFKLILSYWLRSKTNIRITPFIQSAICLYCSDDLLLTPALFDSWINVEDLYKNVYNKRAGGMRKLLNSFGLKHVGRHHCGVDDVRNICNIVLKILNDDVFFDYTFINGEDHGIEHDMQIKENIEPYLDTNDGIHLHQTSQQEM